MGFVALTFAGQLRAQAPKGAVDGWTLSVKVDLDSGANTRHAVRTDRIYAAGRTIRIELDSAAFATAPGRGEPPAEILNGSAHTITMVYPKGRRAVVAATPAQAAGDSAARFVTLPSMTLRDLGPGEAILGHPTHKYSVTTRYVIRTSIGGQPCRRTTDTDEQAVARMVEKGRDAARVAVEMANLTAALDQLAQDSAEDDEEGDQEPLFDFAAPNEPFWPN